MNIKTKPSNLDEVADDLISFWDKNISKIRELAEDEFVLGSHLGGAGHFIRNNYGFWTKDSELYNYFVGIGITHPDDASTIIARTLHRRINNKPEDIEDQVKRFQDFWREAGFPSGMPEINI